MELMAKSAAPFNHLVNRETDLNRWTEKTAEIGTDKLKLTQLVRQ